MSDNYHIAAEADLKPQVSRHIWIYFVVLAVGLFLTTGALMIMFRIELLKEKGIKIGEVVLPEAKQSHIFDAAVLAGKKGLFADKKNVPIDVAMATFLQELHK